MEEREFPLRFIADNFFFEELFLDKENAADILLKFSLISKLSKYHLLDHNVILDEAFTTLTRGKVTHGDAILGAFHPTQCPTSFNGDDIIPKTIRYGTWMATKKPYKTILLTSTEKIKEYSENPHYAKVSSAVTIASPKDIPYFFKVLLE